MSNTKKTCRVCGEAYTACRSQKGDANTFDWKAVACCYEHGVEYFKMVEEARSPKVKPKANHKQKEAKVEVELPVAEAVENIPIEPTTTD